MRRFITSLTGKVFSQLVIFALLLPSISLALLSRSEAQVAVLPRWAVVEFINRKSPGTPLGKTAAQAVNSELAKTGQVDLEADDTVSRQIDQLKIASPPEGKNNLVRLGEALGVSTLVSGTITDHRVLVSQTGSKQAIVTMNVTVFDMASGLPVNGANVTGESTVRPSDAKDEELLEDAIQQGASTAVREIQSHQLPTGTVLNTLNETALVNKGARSGFNIGQEVVVIRGRTQVATARVSDVEPDASTIRIEHGYVGIQPGDKVRAIWTVEVPTVSTIDARGKTHEVHPRRAGNNGSVVTVLLVLGIVAALLSGGNGASQSATADVTSEAMLYPNASGSPAVQVSWSPNAFAKGNAQRAQWQIWRDDVIDGPVLVSPGGVTKVVDTNVDRTATINYLDTGNQVGGVDCTWTSVTNNSKAGATGVRAGHPYQYSVELVYVLSSLDLPGTSTGGSTNGTNTGTTTGTNTGTTTGTNTGTTTGTNTGTTTGTNTGTTTGSNTGTTTGTNGTSQYCYFLSSRSAAKGLATPLNPPGLVDPQNNAQISQQASFHFTSVATGGFNLAVEYVVQLSTTPTFAKGQTVTVAKTQRTGATDITLTLDTINGTGISSAIRNATTIYYRIGARNVADKPGPVKDPTTGERYIFSQWRVVTRTGTPPPPPGVF